MKLILSVLVLAGALCAAPAVLYAEAGPDHKRVGGPKGGRLLENTEPRAEFYLEKDNTVTVSFYDNALKPVSVAEQSVIVIAELNGIKTKLEFEKKGDVLTSKGALPEGEGLNIVVQLKQTASSKPMNFRFALEKGVCCMCKRAEYACVCEH